MSKRPLIIVDCEGVNWVTGTLREFGAVEFETRATFHGKDANKETLEAFVEWMRPFGSNPCMVSDNPCYDGGGMNMIFWRQLGYNPFGHSARRIGDFYAGLEHDFYKTQEWKKLRVTPHDHNPVNDALGNVEAFAKLLRRAAALKALNELRQVVLDA